MTTIKKIVDKEYEIAPYEFEGTLGNLLEKIEGLIKEYGKDQVLDWDQWNYQPYEDDPSPTYRITTYRKETPEEYSARRQKEKEQQEGLESFERSEFERLAKKFGKA
jgi:hypothetical protein